MPLKVEVQSPNGISRYGFIHRTLFSPDADTDAKARDEALQWLAQIARPLRTLTFTCDGIPFVKRGDAVTLNIPELGVEASVWVTQVKHTVSPGVYQMEVDVTFDDPFVKHRERRIVNKLHDTAIQNMRSTSTSFATLPPKPKKATQRGSGASFSARSTR